MNEINHLRHFGVELGRPRSMRRIPVDIGGGHGTMNPCIRHSAFGIRHSGIEEDSAQRFARTPNEFRNDDYEYHFFADVSCQSRHSAPAFNMNGAGGECRHR
jgi:hypothetical protein